MPSWVYSVPSNVSVKLRVDLARPWPQPTDRLYPLIENLAESNATRMPIARAVPGPTVGFNRLLSGRHLGDLFKGRVEDTE